MSSPPRVRKWSALAAVAAIIGSLAVAPFAGAGTAGEKPVNAKPDSAKPDSAKPGGEWALNPPQTHISFSVEAIGLPRTSGEFHNFDGRIAVDFDNPAMSHVAFRVEANSIDAGSTLVSDALRSAAFFDAARYAEIAFVSTKVEKVGAQMVRVGGDLTMLGVTRPLTVDVEIDRRDATPHSVFNVKAHATIDRLAFGMNAGYPLISRDVDLVVASQIAAEDSVRAVRHGPRRGSGQGSAAWGPATKTAA